MKNTVTLQGASAGEIRDYYDSHPDLTLTELARRTGLTVPMVKRILLS